MSGVSLQLTREFLELNGFRVLTQWNSPSGAPRAADGSPMLLAENTQPGDVPEPAEALLRPAEVRGLERAVVEVRPWHTDKLWPSVVEMNPILTQFVSEESLAAARACFDGAPFKTILVISELPANPEQRMRSMALLRQTGVDHILEFHSVLRGVLLQLSAGSNYAPSATLQTLRLLKRYKLIANLQMDLPFPTEPPAARSGGAAAVETAPGDEQTPLWPAESDDLQAEEDAGE
jgi:hypothetical protein